jgi:ABC-type phosphate transport system permease subunit
VQFSALIELGLILFVVTILVNLIAQLLIKGLGGATPSRTA